MPGMHAGITNKTEVELTEYISANPELFSDLSVEELEERLELLCIFDYCGIDCDQLTCPSDCEELCGAQCSCQGDICGSEAVPCPSEGDP